MIELILSVALVFSIMGHLFTALYIADLNIQIRWMKRELESTVFPFIAGRLVMGEVPEKVPGMP